jgi:hypothetical protein
VEEDSNGFAVYCRLYQTLVQLLLVWVVLWELITQAILRLLLTVLMVDTRRLTPIPVGRQEVRVEKGFNLILREYPPRLTVAMAGLEIVLLLVGEL